MAKLTTDTERAPFVLLQNPPQQAERLVWIMNNDGVVKIYKFKSSAAGMMTVCSDTAGLNILSA